MNLNHELMRNLNDIGVPVSFLNYEGDKENTPIYVTFFTIGEIGSEFADDKVTSQEYNVQVDIWAQYGCSIAYVKESIIKNMLNSGWRCTVGPDLFEEETKIYHKPLTFSKESEEI